MKMFKKFSYKEMKSICVTLYNERCYCRAPQTYFRKFLGDETTDKLLEMKWLINSPSTGASWDWSKDCYEFSNVFHKIFSFMSAPFWVWMKIYVLRIYWFREKINDFKFLRNYE